MKKLTRKRKRYLLRKQKKADKRRRRAKRKGGNRPRVEATIARKRQAKRLERIRRAPTVEVHAPAVFSLVENPSEVVDFLARMEQTTRDGSNVRVDLSGVTTLTADAVAVLLSRVKDERYAHEMSVSGNVPQDPAAVDILVESGFFDHVAPVGPRPPSPGNGEIRTRNNYKVDAAASDEVIRQALSLIPGDDLVLDGVQSVVVEAMNNTENHAAGRQGPERWWFSVHCDRDAGIARFCFFDNGIGIFESLEERGLWNSIKRSLGLHNRPDFLRRVLAGEVKSSTGLPHRGKGLPKIAAARKRNQFQRLVILSNSVLADVDSGDFQALPVSFSGTLIYLEHHA